MYEMLHVFVWEDKHIQRMYVKEREFYHLSDWNASVNRVSKFPICAWMCNYRMLQITLDRNNYY